MDIDTDARSATEGGFEGKIGYINGVATIADNRSFASQLGDVIEYVKITDEFIDYGTNYSEYPKGLEAWQNRIDRRTGILRKAK